jgi:hypothetical protein
MSLQKNGRPQYDITYLPQLNRNKEAFHPDGISTTTSFHRAGGVNGGKHEQI